MKYKRSMVFVWILLWLVMGFACNALADLPVAFTNPIFDSVTKTTVTLHWEGPEGALYIVHYETEEQAWQLPPTLEHFAKITGLEPGTKYKVTVEYVPSGIRRGKAIQTVAVRPPHELEENDPFCNLSVEVIGAATALVRWRDSAETQYLVSYGPTASPTRTSMPASERYVVLEGLLPHTVYRIEVRQILTGKTLSTEVRTSMGERYSQHGFRWQSGSFCYVKDRKADVWRQRRVPVAELTPGEIADIVRNKQPLLLANWEWNKTDEDKSWEEMIVLRAPGGKVYLEQWTQTCGKDERQMTYAYYLSSLLAQYDARHPVWKTGTYRIELYFDGQFAGDAAFRVVSGQEHSKEKIPDTTRKH